MYLSWNHPNKPSAPPPHLERAEGRGTLGTGNNKQPHLRSKLSLDYN